jgi:hypothetical protein
LLRYEAPSMAKKTNAKAMTTQVVRIVSA